METDTVQTSIADRLRTYRRAQGYSQQQFALLLGVTQATVSQLENSVIDVSPAMAKRLEQVTNRTFTRAQLRPDLFM